MMSKIFRRSGTQLKNLVLVSWVMLGFMLLGMERVNGTKVPTTNEGNASQPLSVISVDVLGGNMQQNSLEGTSWQLVSWEGSTRQNPVLKDTQITLEFRDNKISGSASCNRYQATYETQGNQLKINVTATTRKACPQEIMQQEMDYLKALQTVIKYKLSSRNQLEIFYQSEQNKDVLIFKPAS